MHMHNLLSKIFLLLFSALKVSNIGAASRPYDLPRVAPGNIIMASKKINVVNEPSAISILDKSGQDPTTSNKKNRQTDVSTNGLPGVNDILTGKFLYFLH